MPRASANNVVPRSLSRRALLRLSAILSVVAALGTPLGQIAAIAGERGHTDPDDFDLPSGSTYVGPRVTLGPRQYRWLVDCGAGAHNARGTLTPALLAGGWTAASFGLCSQTWSRDGLLTVVSQGSLAAIDGYARLLQAPIPPFSAGVPKR